MKKKLSFWIMVFLSLLLLAGCQKPTDPKEATEILVKGIVYQENLDQLDEWFVIDDLGEVGKSKTDFMAEVEGMLDLDEADKKELADVYEKMEQTFREKTSFKVSVMSHEKGKAELEITVIGLTELDDEVMLTKLDQALEAGLKDVTAETSAEEIDELINQFSFEALSASFLAERESKEPEKVKLSLMVDAKEKNKWTIQNKDTFISDLLTAFGQ